MAERNGLTAARTCTIKRSTSHLIYDVVVTFIRHGEVSLILIFVRFGKKEKQDVIRAEKAFKAYTCKYWSDRNISSKIVLVGCKVDLDIKVNEDYIEYFRDRYDLEYFKLSIKNNTNEDTMIDKANEYFREIIIEENEFKNLKDYGIILTEYSKSYKKNYMKLNEEPTVKNTCFSSCLIS